MKGNMEERACALAAYIIENRATVRAAAKKVWRKQVHRPQGLAGSPAAVQPQPLPSGQRGAGGQQGPAPHSRRPGHAEKVQRILKLFRHFASNWEECTDAPQKYSCTILPHRVECKQRIIVNQKRKRSDTMRDQEYYERGYDDAPAAPAAKTGKSAKRKDPAAAASAWSSRFCRCFS